MSRGGLIDHHFSFVGDGRTAGTGTLGDSQELAKKIICNAALQLTYGGWVPSNESFKGDTITDAAWILNSSGSYTKIFMKNDTATYATLEVPMTYTSGGKVTKIWLLYVYGQVSSGTLSYTQCKDNVLKDYLNDGVEASKQVDYEWCAHPASGSSNVTTSVGLCLLYCPPGCSKENSMKIAGLMGGTSSYDKSLSVKCSSAVTYTYHIITKDNTVGIFWHQSGAATSSFGYLLGPMIDTFYDSSDMSCSYKEYFGVTTQVSNKMSDPESSMGNSNYDSFLSRPPTASSNINLQTFGLNPHIQFYNIEGIPQACTSMSDINTSASYNGNPGLFMSARSLLHAINIACKNDQTKPVTYSKIIIGNQLGANPEYWSRQAKVSANNGLKGTINSEFLIAVDSTDYSNGCPNLFTVSQTFDSKNYIHLGSGICMGWDNSNTLGLLDNSPNPMLDITETEPT